MGFQTKPVLSKPRTCFQTDLPEAQMQVIRREVANFLTKRAIRKVSTAEANANPGFYSKLFFVSPSLATNGV